MYYGITATEFVKKVYPFFPATIKELEDGRFKVLSNYYPSLDAAKQAVTAAGKTISASIFKA
jgi:hypothetical protein